MSTQKFKQQQVAWRLFLMSHSILTRKVTEALDAADCISYDTYDVLVTLSEAEGYSMKMGDLADATFFSNSGISRRVSRLEKLGLIIRRQSEKDGRVFHAELTKKGQVALRDAWTIYSDVIEDVFAKSISSKDAKAMTASLRSILRSVDAGILNRWIEEDRTDAPAC